MANNYIAPGISLYRYTCPHCGTVAQMDIDKHWFNSDISINVLTIHRCTCCGKKIIWNDENYIYPDIVPEEANEDMPESVKSLYDEAGLICNKSPRAACALLRLAIDRLCNELGVDEGDINKNIGKLVEKGLPQTVQQALDVVRVVGNKAVHPGQIAFDVDDKATADMLMMLVNIITERMISEPNAIKAMYKKLPESTLNAIERRDKAKC